MLNEVIELSAVVNLGGREISTLTMREPLVGDMLDMKRSNASAEGQELALLARLCGIASEDLLLLSWRDCRKLQKAFQKLAADTLRVM